MAGDVRLECYNRLKLWKLGPQIALFDLERAKTGQQDPRQK